MLSKKNNIYAPILRATGFLGSIQGLNIILNIIRTKCVAMLIGADGVGLNSIFNETRELIHSTSNFGLDVSGIRGMSAAYEKLQQAESESTKEELSRQLSAEVALLRSWVLLLALLGVFLCLALAQPLSRFQFNDNTHTVSFLWLSLAVGFSTITCGEMAVLKGLRRLKKVGIVSVLGVVCGIVIGIPIYYVYGIDGVILAIVSLTFASMLITCTFSFRTERPRYIFSKGELLKGKKMLSVGLNFVVCNIIAHLALLYINSYLNLNASITMVGLYNAGYTMTMSYAAILFAAMDSDYFPRLSGVVGEVDERNETLLRQQDVVLILITPMLVTMMLALPILVPLLLSAEFEAIIPMAQATTVGLLFRAICLNHAYLPLAAGDNKMYLLINTIGALDILLVIVGYEMYGLLGMGIALTVQNAIDLLLVLAISRWHYGIKMSAERISQMLISCLMIISAYAICLLLTGWAYWIAGTLLIALTVIYSYRRYTK